MPIFLPTNRRDTTGAASGFTLFELLLVLAILGLTLTLTVPMLTGRIETARLVQAAEDVAGQIRSAPLQAQLRGQPLGFRPLADRPDMGVLALRVDDGWQVDLGASPTVSALGICSPGRVTVRSPSGRARTILVEAPFCATRIEAGTGTG